MPSGKPPESPKDEPPELPREPERSDQPDKPKEPETPKEPEEPEQPDKPKEAGKPKAPGKPQSETRVPKDSSPESGRIASKDGAQLAAAPVLTFKLTSVTQSEKAKFEMDLDHRQAVQREFNPSQYIGQLVEGVLDLADVCPQEPLTLENPWYQYFTVRIKAPDKVFFQEYGLGSVQIALHYKSDETAQRFQEFAFDAATSTGKANIGSASEDTGDKPQLDSAGEETVEIPYGSQDFWYKLTYVFDSKQSSGWHSDKNRTTYEFSKTVTMGSDSTLSTIIYLDPSEFFNFVKVKIQPASEDTSDKPEAAADKPEAASQTPAPASEAAWNTLDSVAVKMFYEPYDITQSYIVKSNTQAQHFKVRANKDDPDAFSYQLLYHFKQSKELQVDGATMPTPRRTVSGSSGEQLIVYPPRMVQLSLDFDALSEKKNQMRRATIELSYADKTNNCGLTKTITLEKKEQIDKLFGDQDGMCNIQIPVPDWTTMPDIKHKVTLRWRGQDQPSSQQGVFRKEDAEDNVVTIRKQE